jgi:hypothetical protein
MDKSKITEAIEKQQHDPIGTSVMDALLETVNAMIKAGIAEHEAKDHIQSTVKSTFFEGEGPKIGKAMPIRK